MEIRTFTGKDGDSYIVMRTGDEFHVFVEVEAKEAARDCGFPHHTHTRKMWKALWKEKP